MSTSPRDPERLLRRLEWTVLRRLDGALHGNYRTLFRGFGLDLADLRETALRTAFGDAGVDALELSTEDDLVDTLLRFAELRKRRSQLAGGGTPPTPREGSPA